MKQLATLWRKWRQRKHADVVNHKPHMVKLPGGEVVQVSHVADCMGATCPRPQLMTMRILDAMKKGDVLEIISDNPTTVETIPALAMVLYSQHLATLHTDNGWCIYIRKDD